MRLFDFSYASLSNMKMKDFFARLYEKAFNEEDIISNSAQVAFYFAFAIFPLLVFLVSIFGFILIAADDLRSEMFFYLRQVMPKAAYELVQKTIQEVTESSSGGKLTFGILVALWSASAGIDSIRNVLNGVYNLTELRPWWKTKLISLLTTLGLGILVTLALGIVFYGSKFLMLILNTLNLPVQSPVVLGFLQWIIVLLVLITIFAILYNFLPCHREPRWIWITPGTAIGIVLWLLLSYGFKTYLGYFNSYDKTYGSLGAMIILMLWLYLTALVILVGGTINAVLQEFTDPRAAEAGANKAAAKEIVENPDQDAAQHDEIAAGKKAEVLSTVNLKTDENQNDSEPPNDAARSNFSAFDSTAKPAVEKSKLKLFAGLFIGFIENLRRR